MEMTFAQGANTAIVITIMIILYYRHVTGRSRLRPYLRQLVTAFFDRPIVKNIATNVTLVLCTIVLMAFIASAGLKYFVAH